MNSRARQLILAVLLLSLRPAFAAEARIVTFQDALQIALEHNTTLRQAENAARASDITVDQARGQFYPDLALSTRGSQSYGRNFDESEGRVFDTSTQTLGVGLSSSVTLFDGFGNTATLHQAKLDEQASAQELARARETVVFTVASDFVLLLQQQEQLRVRRESLAAESELERQIQNFVDAGARTIADLYQQQSNVAAARLAVVQAERAAQLAEVDLMETLQLDPAGAYQFERLPYDVAAPGDAPTLETMLASAYAQRSDLRAEEQRLEAAGQGIRIAKSGRWPTISFGADYGTNYTSASDVGLSDQFDQRRGGSIGLSFTIPIFNRGNTTAAIRRAEIEQDNAQIALDGLRNQVGLDVRRAYLDLNAAREQLSAADSQVKAAELALQAAQDRYQAGAATLVELTQARAAQVEAASALVTAKSNLVFQRTRVDYFTGKLPVPEDRPGSING
ncbi:MAG TPA: TolC family protein [Steroidobacteraceae bacterium]|nr:TolC family protein [Steroidobacteraceae bacterium]